MFFFFFVLQNEEVNYLLAVMAVQAGIQVGATYLRNSHAFFFHELLNLLLVIVALFYVSIVFGQFNIQAASHRDHFLPKWRETPHPHRVPELLK